MKTTILYFPFLIFPKISKNIFRKILIFEIIILFLLSFLLLFQVVFLTQAIYLRKKYIKEIQEISKEIETLEMNLTKASSLSQVKNHFLEEKFIKVNPKEIKYLEVVEEILVKE